MLEDEGDARVIVEHSGEKDFINVGKIKPAEHSVLVEGGTPGGQSDYNIATVKSKEQSAAAGVVVGHYSIAENKSSYMSDYHTNLEDQGAVRVGGEKYCINDGKIKPAEHSVVVQGEVAGAQGDYNIATTKSEVESAAGIAAVGVEKLVTHYGEIKNLVVPESMLTQHGATNIVTDLGNANITRTRLVCSIDYVY